MKYDPKMKRFEYVYTMTDEERTSNKTEYKHLEVQVGYEIGGMNYFSGGVNPRCYYIGIKPCTIANGFRSCVMMGSGFENGVRVIVQTTSRFSLKSLEKIAGLVDGEKVAKLYAQQNKEGQDALQALIEEVRAKL